jgi:uncharacterized membrane protein
MINPVRAFIVASLLFGSMIIVATPPLRGPDETAHFLRAYGVAAGDIVPAIRDAQGRKGVFLPASLHAGFQYFEDVQATEKVEGWSGPVFRAYFDRPPASGEPGADFAFVLYAGSEGYTPIPYLPQAAAALIARALDLDFLATFYLMRFAGLIAMTALIAFAIAIVPQVGWAFFAIAMLPAAFYGRSVINADGAALATAMMVSGLWLRGMLFPQMRIAGRESFWMMLNALAKPTNAALVLLELANYSSPHVWRLFRMVVVILPAIAVTALWSFRSQADTAAWRMVELTGYDLTAFDPVFKIRHLLADPLHFPAAIVRTMQNMGAGELGRQVIGVLGLFDTVLEGWVYPALTIFLFGTFLAALPANYATRRRIAIGTAVTGLAYVLGVYFICYLVFTPHDSGSMPSPSLHCSTVLRTRGSARFWPPRAR